jgi:hypothetical protein
VPLSSYPEDLEAKCILEPVCLEAFIFAACPHPEVNCSRHRYEALAEGEGQRFYGPVEWKSLREADPYIIVQMIEEVRERENVAAR